MSVELRPPLLSELFLTTAGARGFDAAFLLVLVAFFAISFSCGSALHL